MTWWCIFTLQWRHESTCGQRADHVRLFVFYLSLGLVRVCEIELSHMGKNSGNSDLVCEKKRCFTHCIIYKAHKHKTMQNSRNFQGILFHPLSCQYVLSGKCCLLFTSVAYIQTRFFYESKQYEPWSDCSYLGPWCLQYRPPDKSVYWNMIFFISQPKHMLWVLKRTISKRWFFWAPKTHV